MQNTFAIIAQNYAKHVEQNVQNMKQNIVKNVQPNVKHVKTNAKRWQLKITHAASQAHAQAYKATHRSQPAPALRQYLSENVFF